MFGSYRKLGQTENIFCVDRNISAHGQKIFSASIFTSNELHSSHNTLSELLSHALLTVTLQALLTDTLQTIVTEPYRSSHRPSSKRWASTDRRPTLHRPTICCTHGESDPPHFSIRSTLQSDPTRISLRSTHLTSDPHTSDLPFSSIHP